MKKYSKYISIFLVILMVLPGLSQVVLANGQIKTIRLAGNDRSLTSIEVSMEAYKGGASSVVLAGYKGSADALTGTLIATVKDSPLLILAKSGLTKEIKTEIQRLGAKNVYILGGYASISKETENELKGLGLTVERISGNNRYETAVKIAEYAKMKNAAYLALGRGAIRADGSEDSLADALAIGSLAAQSGTPVLLTKTNELPKETEKALKDKDIKVIIIVGGSMAVSDSLKSKIEKMGIIVQRISGANRYETAVKIAGYFKPPTNLILANGIKDADALVGGYLGYKKNAPVLLTKQDILPPETKAYMQQNQITTYILGGQGVISDESLEAGVNLILNKVPGVADDKGKRAELHNQGINYKATCTRYSGNENNITIIDPKKTSQALKMDISGDQISGYNIVVFLGTDIFGKPKSTVKDVVDVLWDNKKIKEAFSITRDLGYADNIVKPIPKTYFQGGIAQVDGTRQEGHLLVLTDSKLEAETYELTVTIDKTTAKKDIVVYDNDTDITIAKRIEEEFKNEFTGWKVYAVNPDLYLKGEVRFVANSPADNKDFKIIWKIK